MSQSTDEEILLWKFKSIHPPAPRASNSAAIAAAHRLVASRRRRRTGWAAAGTVFGVVLLAGGTAVALQTVPGNVSASSEQAPQVLIPSFSSWAGRGSKLEDTALLARAETEMATQSAGAQVSVLFAGSVYGGQGSVVVTRWSTPTGWKVGLLTTPMVGLNQSTSGDAADLAVRSVVSVPNASSPGYVGFIAPQKTRDGGTEAFAFALAAPGAGAGTFRAAMMEVPETDQSTSSQLEADVTVAILPAGASPWNTYLSTAAGSFGLLGTTPSGPAPVQVEATGATRADSLVEVATAGDITVGDIITSPAGVYGVVERTLGRGRALVKPDVLSAAAHLQVYSHISHHTGTLTPATGDGIFAEFVPDDPTVAGDVNRVVGKPSANSPIVVGIGQAVPGTMNLKHLDVPAAMPLYLISLS